MSSSKIGECKKKMHVSPYVSEQNFMKRREVLRLINSFPTSMHFCDVWERVTQWLLSWQLRGSTSGCGNATAKAPSSQERFDARLESGVFLSLTETEGRGKALAGNPYLGISF
jgi:hypothetical protein